MSNNTVFLTREEVGLVHWDDFRKPPYSAQDYHDAYNNGVNMVAAFMSANAEGASKVVLERGNYPFCYSQDRGGSTTKLSHTTIKGTSGLTIDGNSSCVFVIFDSENRNPYHLSETTEPYELPGAVFYLESNTDLSIEGFNIRGDQYNRSWVAGEENTEQTYGIVFQRDNIRTEINVVAHGFRGDAISGATKDVTLILRMEEDWQKGGLSKTTGLPIDLVGAYKTPKADLDGKQIYRNAIQVVSAGYIKIAEFRDDRFDVFFYDQNDNFISSESSYQTDFIYLPKNCRYVQVVAYGDERTDPLVGYGYTVWIATGSSEYCTIRGEYYANHRGGISNLCGYTYIDANIHDNGSLKYGFPHYNNSTRYGINFEDIFSNKLTVRGKIKNCVQGVLYNGRHLDVQAEIRDINVGAVLVYDTVEVNVTNSVIENVGYNLFEYDGNMDINRKKPVFRINNNLVKNCMFNGRYNSDVNTSLMVVSDNTFVDCAINLEGNGKNIIWENNTQTSVIAGMNNTAAISQALRITNNTIIANMIPSIDARQGLQINGLQSSGNTLYTDFADGFFGSYTNSVPGVPPIKINGLTLHNSNNMTIKSIRKPIDDETSQKISISDCKLLGDYLTIGIPNAADRFSNLDVEIKDTLIRGGSADKYNRYAIALSIRETATTGLHRVVIRDSIIDVTYCTDLLGVIYEIKGALDIVFINCTFTSDEAKKIRFLYSYYGFANITARAIGCEFVNVINGK